MFLLQHPEDYLHALEIDRARDERRRRLVRELRGAQPSGTKREARRSNSAVSAPPERASTNVQALGGSAHPCPDLNGAVTP